MTLYKIILQLFLLFFTIIANGQGNSLFFRHLTTNEGLSNNTVYAINEDSLGFIWIGTRSGLNRFDATVSGFMTMKRDYEMFS